MIHIKSKRSWFDIDFKELFRYRDLIWLFFKRNYATLYKQSILGPIWLILNPMITVLLYAFVFGRLAGLSADGIPQIVFYLCSNSIWAFFSTSLAETAKTFTANAAILGKVYFPRLIMPISSVLSGFLTMIIQLAMLGLIMLIYTFYGYHFSLGTTVLIAPFIIIQVGFLGLACGIIIASLTTKYRDLVILVGFGIQLWMYETPVVYTAGIVPQKYINFYMLNPMTPIMECWRSAVIGSGLFLWDWWGVSWIMTFILLFVGILLFNRVEKTFMDTV